MILILGCIWSTSLILMHQSTAQVCPRIPPPAPNKGIHVLGDLTVIVSIAPESEQHLQSNPLFSTSLASHTLQSPRERGSGTFAYIELCCWNSIMDRFPWRHVKFRLRGARLPGIQYRRAMFNNNARLLRYGNAKKVQSDWSLQDLGACTTRCTRSYQTLFLACGDWRVWLARLGVYACCKNNQSIDIGEKLVCTGFEFLKKAY